MIQEKLDHMIRCVCVCVCQWEQVTMRSLDARSCVGYLWLQSESVIREWVLMFSHSLCHQGGFVKGSSHLHICSRCEAIMELLITQLCDFSFFFPFCFPSKLLFRHLSPTLSDGSQPSGVQVEQFFKLRFLRPGNTCSWHGLCSQAPSVPGAFTHTNNTLLTPTETYAVQDKLQVCSILLCTCV